MSADDVRRYRERLRKEGKTEVLLKLPVETVEVLDRLRVAQGASSRGDVVVSLIRSMTENGNELKIA